MQYRIVPATEDLLRAMAPHVRPLEVAEMAALGHAPESGLLESLRLSIWGRAAVTRRGRPICAWGLVPVALVAGIGRPWMLSTPLVGRNRRAFLRESRRQLAEMAALCPVLVNRVPAADRVAVGWLRRLGFRFGPPEDIGGVPFLPFERIDHG